MDEKIEKLSKYGLVKTCKIINNQVLTIVLTDGFSEKVRETMEFLVLVQELFPEFNKMETTITEKDLAIVVLSKK